MKNRFKFSRFWAALLAALAMIATINSPTFAEEVTPETQVTTATHIDAAFVDLAAQETATLAGMVVETSKNWAALHVEPSQYFTVDVVGNLAESQGTITLAAVDEASSGIGTFSFVVQPAMLTASPPATGVVFGGLAGVQSSWVDLTGLS